MFIEINDTKTITDVQNEFSAQFPFLHIAFFEKPHGYEEASEDVKFIYDKKLGDIRDKHVTGIIATDPTRQTGAVEQEFERRFGLHVQIYRKLMDQWVQTVGTDMLTLEQQNNIASHSYLYYNPDHKI